MASFFKKQKSIDENGKFTLVYRTLRANLKNTIFCRKLKINFALKKNLFWKTSVIKCDQMFANINFY